MDAELNGPNWWADDDDDDEEALDIEAAAEAAGKVSFGDVEGSRPVWRVSKAGMGEDIKDSLAREKRNRDLVRAMRAGDVEARDKLLVQNIALVFHWANMYAKRSSTGLGWDDMCSEGTLGLMKAVEKFDPDGPKPFAAVATLWVKQAIRRALVTKARIIQLPERLEHELWRMRKAQDALKAELRAEPTAEQIAARLTADARKVREKAREKARDGKGTASEAAEAAEVTPERVRELLAVGEHPLSLDQPVGEPDENGETLTLGDLIAADVALPSDEADRNYMVDQMMENLDKLPPRDQEVLRAWAGFYDKPGVQEGRVTLDQLAAKLKVSRERVRQIRDRALRKLSEKLWEER